MTRALITTLSIFTLSAHALIVLLACAWIIDKTAGTAILARVRRKISPFALGILFLIPFGAMLGSLAFSEILKFEPCQLCWYQRMALYPQIILALIALWRNDRGIIPYLLALSGIGAIVSAYQYIGQMASYYGATDLLKACVVAKASCSDIYFLQFGYITIPLMTFTAFALIIITSLIAKNTKE